MVALRSTRKGFRNWLAGAKPARPTAKGNAAAFKAGDRSFKANNGPTADLLRVVRLSLENDAPTRK